ncbi:uncharacterized protein I206_101651 [Kwoniella pini CBS 10737]|uniref:Protein kinase domain-containing protein n=1 Tax=Kwoniella pini CBS 10737 TaxID=1296096 RepID=A0A1B9HW54_9TREE|nr:uncharacterized protein I206_06379 [Kwoniella pini CBS 10737]OCF47478.1 hypothetical protein I206_06379 [Kwoniella pini CBS 10737]
MSFIIQFAPSLHIRGRSYLKSGLRFDIHPSSQYRHPTLPVPIQQTSVSPTISGSRETDTLLSNETLRPPLYTLTVHQYLAAGYLWDFWLATHPLFGQVVLKLVFIPEYPCRKPDYDFYIPKEQIFDEVSREDKRYLGSLASVQGDLVPFYYGMYGSKNDGSKKLDLNSEAEEEEEEEDEYVYYAILMEYIDHPIGPGSVWLDQEWKPSILAESLDVSDTMNYEEQSQFISDLEPAFLETPTSPSATNGMSILAVHEYIAAGYLWDFWRATHPLYGDVILKLVFVLDYPCAVPGYDNYIPEHRIIKEALREERRYLGPLAQLQGSLVPKYYGLYASKGDEVKFDGQEQEEEEEEEEDYWYFAILLEYAGNPIGPGSAWQDSEWKDKLYSAYERLHLHGVVHTEICSRHVLIDDEGRIRLVSFRRSSTGKLTKRRDVRELMLEGCEVRTNIGMENVHETTYDCLPPTYWSKLPDPDGFIRRVRANRNRPLPDWAIAINEWQDRQYGSVP